MSRDFPESSRIPPEISRQPKDTANFLEQELITTGLLRSDRLFAFVVVVISFFSN